MLATVIPAPEPVLLDVEGSTERFPVRRVYCVGRNYADHAIEMGHDPSREPPFFFQKNADNIYNGETFPYPPLSSDVHFEVEMVMALSAGGAISRSRKRSRKSMATASASISPAATCRTR